MRARRITPLANSCLPLSSPRMYVRLYTCVVQALVCFSDMSLRRLGAVFWISLPSRIMVRGNEEGGERVRLGGKRSTDAGMRMFGLGSSFPMYNYFPMQHRRFTELSKSLKH